MIFIDKSLREEDGRAINIRFLKDYFDAGTLRFSIPLDKSAYGIYATDARYRDEWRKILCEEQSHLCCYCMRRISLDGFSAEHIVPQSLKGEADRPEYLRYVSGPDAAPNITRCVEYSDDTETRAYTSAADIDALSKMPHVIAHQNLLAACKGIRGSEINGCCCNNERGRDFLVPYMLIPGGSARFKYDVNGIISMSPEERSWNKMIKTLNGATFQTIRRIWYMIARNTRFREDHFDYTTSELQRMNILKTAFKEDNFLKIPEKYKTFAGKIMGNGNDYTWRLLVDYSWFLQYYRNN